MCTETMSWLSEQPSSISGFPLFWTPRIWRLARCPIDCPFSLTSRNFTKLSEVSYNCAAWRSNRQTCFREKSNIYKLHRASRCAKRICILGFLRRWQISLNSWFIYFAAATFNLAVLEYSANTFNTGDYMHSQRINFRTILKSDWDKIVTDSFRGAWQFSGATFLFSI